MAPQSFLTKPLDQWGLGLERPLLIAGPCSAETEEQVLDTARGIRTHTPQVKAFRAGVWKPRTRPGGFEGAGSAALPWLQRVKAETGLLTIVEVATAEHVEQALSAGVDMLWVGARTTPNPFSVQAIADALHGMDVPVFVKNPINPDLHLWIGALERLSKAGV
ncbi:MAG TPA: 3-deoxy-7-phosphoheptulonate synthase, partial [Flavobacteriales bacterium]|nr:3-deoxy-7-phosphoheptulonate synthase [Flavobacteriales bacterium]